MIHGAGNILYSVVYWSGRYGFHVGFKKEEIVIAFSRRHAQSKFLKRFPKREIYTITEIGEV